MSFMIGLVDSLLNWSVERKMVVLLLLGIVLFPLTTLLILQSQGAQLATNFLVGLLAVAIITLVPFAKMISHLVALRSIKELNDQCKLLKRGDYAHVDLPAGDDEGHDFLTLKRNMHWMGYTIATREQRLQSAMKDLAVAQRQIGESLDYASLIQTSFLPDREAFSELLPEHFLIWSQRDKVGGDSYWFKQSGDGFFLGVIDCTGHGVPGAFMTLIVHSLLEEAMDGDPESPAIILSRMNQLIKDALKQHKKGAMSDDGMDCTLCHLDPKTGKLLFAGANNPLFIVEKDEVRSIKGDRCGLGYIRSPRDFSFTDVEMSLAPGTRVYMATDGIVDQVGGDKGFPFGKRRFMDFIKQTRQLPMEQQGSALMRLFADYQGEQTRRDDVTVLGFEYR
ncbi:PP2C family protein-serine/threonine phosphatase [Pseudodesulfovibrio piezophilus]|uniref:Protein serine/threonine phosphatase n=1 Tax=Pseudodesulfovibrio piezophilus (strain DSM 21447 / JCM 15486 / C1TLV30) TaxID=1322246 RepID=M1WSF4_PSEP2|nr:PP2C family protein-serine/threonine phosphatase [Pseudodesulfovibrio piezophilus]CCH50159.1 Protein serine/threonine phosphatase [Pseudodesulfovibrio piezophilus C1TLV30]